MKIEKYLNIEPKRQEMPFNLLKERQSPDMDRYKCDKYFHALGESDDIVYNMPDDTFSEISDSINKQIEKFINGYYESKTKKQIKTEDYIAQSVAASLISDFYFMQQHNAHINDEEEESDEIKQLERKVRNSRLKAKCDSNIALQKFYVACNTGVHLEDCFRRGTKTNRGDVFENTIISSISQGIPTMFEVAMKGTVRSFIESFILKGKEVTRENVARMFLFKDEYDVFRFLRELISRTERLVYDGVCASMVLDYNSSLNDEKGQKKLQHSNDNLKAENKKLKEQVSALKKQKGDDEKAIEDRISMAVDKAVKKQQKAVSDEIYSLKKQISNKTKEYDALNEKYQRLKDEQHIRDEYEATISENSESLNEEEINEIKSRRIVFVRDKEKDSYKVFQKLKEEYPNSKIIDSNSSTIDENATDMVVVMTQYVAHGSYWDARGTAKNKTIPVLHCPYLNLERIFEVIAYRLAYNQTQSR